MYRPMTDDRRLDVNRRQADSERRKTYEIILDSSNRSISFHGKPVYDFPLPIINYIPTAFICQ